MTITKKHLQEWEQRTHIPFTDEQKQVILERFGSEPCPHEWSEQDIQVQIDNYMGYSVWEKPMVRSGSSEAFPPGVDF